MNQKARYLDCAVILFCVVMISGSSTAHGQSFVEGVYPPSLQRGQRTQLSFQCKPSGAPVGLWTSLPPGLVRAIIPGENPATGSGVGTSPNGTTSPADRASSGYTIEVEVAKDAPLGLYGMRLATQSGLSNMHLFAIDELPQQVQVQGTIRDVVNLNSLPVSYVSEVRAAAVDRYLIAVSAGQRVAFEVIGNRFGKDFDPLVVVRNSAGKIVAECDNSVGLFFDCRFAHTFLEAGRYLVEVRDSRFDGHNTWSYALRIGDFPECRSSVPAAIRTGETNVLSFPQIPGWQLPISVSSEVPLGTAFWEVRHSPTTPASWIPLLNTRHTVVSEIEPNNSAMTATKASVPASLCGVLGTVDDVDHFEFELTAGQKLAFQGHSKRIGSAADLELVVLDPDLREVRRIDDFDLDEAEFAWNAGKAGSYRLMVRDLAEDGGAEFTYRVDVVAGGPAFQLLAETSDLTIPINNYQPLPVKVTRTEFDGEIQLQLVGAPPGVTIEPATIPAGTSEFVPAVKVPAGVTLGLYNIQLLGTATLPTGQNLQAIAQTKPLIDKQLKNVDLITYALRDDQRYLPPSLTNRLALMVAPAVPFDVVLPDNLVSLTRYQSADFPIQVKRDAGFQSPLQFTAKGGQIGDEREERNQVYLRFHDVMNESFQMKGTFHNRILTQLNKHRVDLTAVAEHQGRSVHLVRSFTLDIQSAFKPAYDPLQLTIEPGKGAKVALVTSRVPTFTGPVTYSLTPVPGLQFPETVEIPAGKDRVEIEILADKTMNPGRRDIRIQVAGFVGKYEESFNAPNLSIEVKKMDDMKKTAAK